MPSVLVVIGGSGTVFHVVVFYFTLLLLPFCLNFDLMGGVSNSCSLDPLIHPLFPTNHNMHLMVQPALDAEWDTLLVCCSAGARSGLSLTPHHQ